MVVRRLPWRRKDRHGLRSEVEVWFLSWRWWKYAGTTGEVCGWRLEPLYVKKERR